MIKFGKEKSDASPSSAYRRVSNHTFVNGNKRIGVYVLLTFLEVNGISLDVSDEELIEIGLSLAKSEMKYEELLARVKTHEV